MIISHPHFYTTWPDWVSTFNCPIYLAAPDQEWLNRKTPANVALRFLTDTRTTLAPGVTAIIAGGHFNGSMMLHVAEPALKVSSLFHADTIFDVPTANNPDPNKQGINSYSFMWSVPSMIPLSPDQILGIWKAMKGFDLKVSYGLMGTVRQKEVGKDSLLKRVLESAKIAVKHMGYEKHSILDESM